MVDWRANRLVDALAKNGAATIAHPEDTIKLIKSAEALVKHRLAQLAQATHRVNNHVVTTIDDDGVWVTKTLRPQGSTASPS